MQKRLSRTYETASFYSGTLDREYGSFTRFSDSSFYLGFSLFHFYPNNGAPQVAIMTGPLKFRGI